MPLVLHSGLYILLMQPILVSFMYNKLDRPLFYACIVCVFRKPFGGEPDLDSWILSISVLLNSKLIFMQVESSQVQVELIGNQLETISG